MSEVIRYLERKAVVLNATKVKATVQCPVENKEVTLKHCIQECNRYHHIAYRGQTNITIYCRKE